MNGCFNERLPLPHWFITLYTSAKNPSLIFSITKSFIRVNCRTAAWTAINEALLLRAESGREGRRFGVELDHVTSKLDNESLLSMISEWSDALLSIVHSISNLVN